MTAGLPILEDETAAPELCGATSLFPIPEPVWSSHKAVSKLSPRNESTTQRRPQSAGRSAYLRDAGKLPAGEVGEPQVVEASRDRGVALDEGPPHGVTWQLPVHECVVAQQPTVCTEGDTADVTSGGGTGCPEAARLVPPALLARI